MKEEAIESRSVEVSITQLAVVEGVRTASISNPGYLEIVILPNLKPAR